MCLCKITCLLYGVFFYKTEIMESTLDTRIDMHFYRIGKVNCDSICFKDTIMPLKSPSRARAYLMERGAGEGLMIGKKDTTQ